MLPNNMRNFRIWGVLIMDKTFVLHWLDGTAERVSGPSIETAFALAGYGGGAINALDYYEEVDDTSADVLE